MTGRRTVAARADLIAFGALAADRPFLRLAVPAARGIDLTRWFAEHRARVEDELAFGAILFRGFGVDTAELLRTVSEALSGPAEEYSERRSPRTALGDRVYTSTIHPASEFILFHGEMSYAHRWPLRLHFCCIRPADEGGSTPLSDARAVLARLSGATRDRFARLGVRYHRTFGAGTGLSWRETFQVDRPEEADAFCRAAGIDFAWAGEQLRTAQTRHAIASHPRTGEAVWFNQAHHFHRRALPPAVRRALREQTIDDATYGDGAPIDDATIDEIVAAYAAEATEFGWERGDLLVIDNMLVAHARRPYRGERLVALSLARIVEPERRAGGVAEFR